LFTSMRMPRDDGHGTGILKKLKVILAMPVLRPVWIILCVKREVNPRER